MNAGDVFKVVTGKGEHEDSFDVELEDRVLSDRSAGQYESGWWVYDTSCPSDVQDNEPWCYFLADDGRLYGKDEHSSGFTICIGEAPEVVAKYEAWCESFHE